MDQKLFKEKMHTTTKDLKSMIASVLTMKSSLVLAGGIVDNFIAVLSVLHQKEVSPLEFKKVAMKNSDKVNKDAVVEFLDKSGISTRRTAEFALNFRVDCLEFYDAYRYKCYEQSDGPMMEEKFRKILNNIGVKIQFVNYILYGKEKNEQIQRSVLPEVDGSVDCFDWGWEEKVR
ncbi:MAG: hypothetical protein WCR72_16970 [Bacteroidota bacterium]